MVITFLPHALASTSLRPVDVEYPRFVNALRTHVVGPKDAEAFIPGEVAPCDCGKHQPGLRHRLAANVKKLYIFVVDIDHLTAAELTAYLDRLKARDVNFAAYSTHSHTEAVPKARILFPLSKPVEIENPREWSHGTWPKLMKKMELTAGKADATCRDPSRLFFLPRVARADSPRFFTEWGPNVRG